MRRLFVFFLLFAATPSVSQWRLRFQRCQVLTFGMHDTSLFIGTHPTLGVDKQIYRYTPQYFVDGGTSGIDRSIGDITSFASLGSSFFAGQTFSGGGNALIYRSTDNGSTWKKNDSIGAPAVTNGRYLFAVDAKGISRSRDTGNTWVSTKNGLSPDNFVAIGPCVVAGTPTALYHSSDTGALWTQIPAPFTEFTSAVVVGTKVYATNGVPETKTGQLMRSLDSGVHWSLVSTPSFTVQCLATDGKHLFAGGHEGLYLLDTDGVTWLPKTDSLPHPAIVALGVFDTLLFADMSYSGYYLYSRSIPAMFDTQRSAVAEQLLADTLPIYPNPTTSGIRIDFGSAAVHRIELLNLLGESKQIAMPREQSVSLDLSQLPSGTYFLRIETAKGSEMRKIVKE